MQVFADVQAPTVVRSAALGLEATVYPGINEFDDDDFAAALIEQGAVLPVPTQPLVSTKDEKGNPVKGDHEPHYAPLGQGVRLDIESGKKSGVVDRASAMAHNRALAATNDLDAEAEKARGIAVAQAALADPDSKGIFHAEIRRTPIVGTEAMHRLDLTDEEKNEEVKARSLGISRATQQALGVKRSGGRSKAARPAKPTKRQKKAAPARGRGRRQRRE